MVAKVKKIWSGVDVTGFDPYKDALQVRLIHLIWNDEVFKQEILTNPKALFERETGIKFPENIAHSYAECGQAIRKITLTNNLAV